MALTDEFEYGGYHFSMVGTIPKNVDFDALYKENSPADAHIVSSTDTEFDTEEFLNAFYAATAAPETEALVFTCKETGGRWIVMDCEDDGWLEEYNGPVVTDITEREFSIMWHNFQFGRGDVIPNDIFICACDDGDYILVDNSKGEFSRIEFILKEDLDNWLKSGTLPSEYRCEDILFPVDPSEIDFLIAVGKNKYVTVRCKLYEGFHVMDNPGGGWVSGRDGIPDESYHFSEDAVINIARRECKKRFPQYFNPEPEQKPEQKKPTSGIRR